MTIEQFDIDMALLSALVNGDMNYLNPDTSNFFDAAGGDKVKNLIHDNVIINTQPMIAVNGWNPIEVQFSKITALAPNVTSYSDLAGLAAATFIKDGKAVISFRGTEDEIGDWAADAVLTSGGISKQLYAAYYYTKVALDKLHDAGIVDANITFTGHSLGGALASAMAQYFGINGVVFDSAPNLNSSLNLADGAPGYTVIAPGVTEAGIPTATTNILWPSIPASTSAPGEVRLYFTEHDPVSQSVGDAGGGRLGGIGDITPDSHMFDLNADMSFFSTPSNRVELAGAFAVEAATNVPILALHSVHLILLEMLLDSGSNSGVHKNSLGDVSQNLIDLLTQVFNSDVNLRTKIGHELGVTDPAVNTRYDIFLRQLINDKINNNGEVTNMWLNDLGKLANVNKDGRLGIAGVGTEDGIKSTFEWAVMRSLIQSTIQYAAQESLKQIPGHIGTIDDSGIIGRIGDTTNSEGNVIAGDVIYADLSKLDPDIAPVVAQTAALMQPFLGNPSVATLSSAQQLLFGAVRHIVADAGADSATILQGPNIPPNGMTEVTLLAGFNGDDTLIAGNRQTLFYGGAGVDTADMSGWSQGVSIHARAQISAGHSGGGIQQWADVMMATVPYGAIHYTVEKIILTDFVDTITGDISRLGFSEINTRDKADFINIYGESQGTLTINTGNGDDIIRSVPNGTIIQTGDGHDKIELIGNTYIADPSSDDRITFRGTVLSGGTTNKIDESPWAYGKNKIAYGRNGQDDLVIKSPEIDLVSGKAKLTFVAHFSYNGGVNPTAGIRPIEVEIGVYRLLEAKKLLKGAYDTFETWVGSIYKAMLGYNIITGADPLVLDLDGDGVELLSRSSISPKFDIDGDNFAERTGWVNADDGLLARDLNGNGKIDNISELFGNANTSGLAALGVLNSNADGVIDSNDTAWSDLRVWKDANGNGITDAGELLTMEQAHVASINLTANSTTASNVAGNTVNATGAYTTTEGETHQVADVSFFSDQMNTIWLGDNTINATAAALPEVKGFGTLTDLRVAMTLSPTLATTVAATLGDLNSPNLEELRYAVTPILNAWRNSISLPAGTAGTVARGDFHVLVQDTETGRNVVDFIIKVTDENGSFYKLASGEDILDSQGAVIERPSMANIFDQAYAGAHWDVLSGDQIQFAERYMGVSMPLSGPDASLQEGAGAIAAATDVLNTIWEFIDETAVRLAVQGPLASYFTGISYDVTENDFNLSSSLGLVPVFENILVHAPAGNEMSWLSDWKDFLKVFMPDVDRGASYLEATYAWRMQNLVAAYENVGFGMSLTATAGALGIPSDLIHEGTGTLVGSNDADLMYLGAGNQLAQGGLGPDSYIVGANFGSDVIDDYEGPDQVQKPDYLRFAQHNVEDLTFTRDGVDLVITENGTTNQVRVIGQFVGIQPGFFGANLRADQGVHEIIFKNGKVYSELDIAYAVSHPDAASTTLNGTPDYDVLDGGAGNDLLVGGDDGDIYIYGKNYGHDTVSDQQTYILLDNMDTVLFRNDIDPENVHFTRNGASNDLIIEFADSPDDTLTIHNQFEATYTGSFGTQWLDRVEAFSFSDGSFYLWDELFSKVLDELKTDGDDTIYGFAWEDTLDGGAGNDFLSGGNEDDTYIFGRGYGIDVIYDDATNILSGHYDVLRMNEGVTADEVVLSRNGASSDVTLTLADGSQVTLQDEFTLIDTGPFGLVEFNRIEKVEFADGTYWTSETLQQKLLDAGSTTGNDVIYGFDYRNDTIVGGAGNDALIGMGGDDILIGGTGNDILTGGWGNDTYIFNLGDGQDVVADYYQFGGPLPYYNGWGGTEVIQFGEGITADDLTFTQAANGRGLTITYGDQGDSIYLDGGIDPDYIIDARIEELRFSDGTTMGIDEFIAISQTPTSGNDIIYGMSSNDVLTGLAGDDILVGRKGNDTLAGGAGNDLLTGADGNDTYVFNLGDGQDTVNELTGYAEGWGGDDAIQFGAGITLSNITVTGSNNGYDMIINVNGTSDQLTIVGAGDDWLKIEHFNFADGTSLTYDQFHLLQGNNVLLGTAGNDSLYGSDGNNTLMGLGGDDWLAGWYGNDRYIYNQGDGNDTIEEYVQSTGDILSFGTGITPGDLKFSAPWGGELIVSFKNFEGSVRLLGVGNDYNLPIEQVNFADGTIWSAAEFYQNAIAYMSTPGDDLIVGTMLNDTVHAGDGNDWIETYGGNDTVFGEAGNDNIYTHSGDDVINGGAGNNWLDGGWGNDTYVHNIDGGNDIIDEHLEATADTISFGPGITASNLLFSADGNYDLKIQFTNASGSVTVLGLWRESDLPIDQVTFADGTVWDSAAFYQAAIAGMTTSGDDIILGSGRADVIDGGAGNDTIYARAGNDVVHGGAGDDFIDGATGNNTLYGDDGNDSIYASYANDTIYGGNGDDYIDAGEGSDIISGGAGNDTIYVRWGNKVIDGGPGADTVDYSGSWGVNYVNLSGSAQTLNGQTIAANSVNNGYGTTDSVSNIENIKGGVYGDYIVGNDESNIIYGGAGDDNLDGGNGNDTLSGDAGNDYINGNNGFDVVDYSSAAAGVLVNLGAGNQTLNGVTLAAGVAQDGLGGTDTLVNIEQIIGSSHNDWFVGGAGAETFIGGAGNDSINGGAGYDLVDYSGSTSSVLVNLGTASQTLNGVVVVAGTAQDGLGGTDTLANIEQVVGSSHNDWFVGGAGAETFIGGAGNDSINGGAGYDLVDYNSSTSSVLVNLGATSQTLNGVVVVAGTAQDGLGGTDTLANIEQVIGSSYNDWFVGGAGAETFIGGAGDDSINGGAGFDTLDYSSSVAGVLVNMSPSSQTLNGTVVTYGTVRDGYGGTDTIAAIERVVGSVYADNIFGSNWDDTLEGGSGDDVINGGIYGNDTLIGGLGNDSLNGGLGTDTVDYSSSTGSVLANLSSSAVLLKGISVAAGAAQDGLGGTDILTSIEKIIGSSQDDWLVGGTAAETFIAGAGNDTIIAGDGNDTLIGGAGADYLDGQGGDNIVSYADSPSAVFINISPYNNVNLNGNILAAYTGMDGWGSVDSYANIKGIVGSAYDDWLLGSDLSDSIRGGAGNDHIIGSWGNDTMIGDAGNDYIDGNGGNNTVAYSSSVMGVTVNLSTQSASDGFGYTDTLIGINNVTGSDYADTIIGDGTANIIRAGKGNDLVTGGAGADTFVFANGEGADRITDYEDGVDHFELKALGISYAGLSFTDTVDGCKISWSGGDIFTLSGVTASQMNSGDFIFTT